MELPAIIVPRELKREVTMKMSKILRTLFVNHFLNCDVSAWRFSKSDAFGGLR